MNLKSMENEIAQISTPLRELADFDPLMNKIKDKRIVMLGESSHGTQEFYEWRRLITNELIKEHGFNFIAVEGDWPPCQSINNFIQAKSTDDALSVMSRFTRWPTWMWGNTEIMKMMDDLRAWNQKSLDQVGFHGLDVYSLYESMEVVIKKLNQIDPILAASTNDLYDCFEPFRHDERAYARSLLNYPSGCAAEVVKALEKILQSNMQNTNDFFDVIQNARIIKSAERYYHTMVSHDEDCWNIRDEHMMDTLETLLNHYGSESKAIIWAHNTHVGDYRATDMLTHGQVNLGGLARQKYGTDQVALIGFTTFTGQVVASHSWDGPIEIMDIPRARISSLEFALHSAISKVGHPDFYLDFEFVPEDSTLNDYIGHRAIGVVYHPEYEHRGNYVPTIPAQRYDAMIFFNETRGVAPLNVEFQKGKIPETYPFGDRI